MTVFVGCSLLRVPIVLKVDATLGSCLSRLCSRARSSSILSMGSGIVRSCIKPRWSGGVSDGSKTIPDIKSRS